MMLVFSHENVMTLVFSHEKAKTDWIWVLFRGRRLTTYDVTTGALENHSDQTRGWCFFCPQPPICTSPFYHRPRGAELEG